jgi:hypothetical protein
MSLGRKNPATQSTVNSLVDLNFPFPVAFPSEKENFFFRHFHLQNHESHETLTFIITASNSFRRKQLTSASNCQQNSEVS